MAKKFLWAILRKKTRKKNFWAIKSELNENGNPNFSNLTKKLNDNFDADFNGDIRFSS